MTEDRYGVWGTGYGVRGTGYEGHLSGPKKFHYHLPFDFTDF